MEPDELEGLIATLTSADDESREAAATALGRLGARAVDPLEGLLGDGDAETRWWATRALAETATGAAVGPLVGALADRDPDVRACAGLALGRLGRGAAAPALAACLADESAFVAGVASDALGMIGEPAVEALAQTVAEEDPHVRLLAVRALGRIPAQSAVGPLFGALDDSSYLVRYYAWEALEARGVGMVYLKP